ncbi:hypothetical protein A2U01_0086031, partial [Trifolium medium]|nr:hypothetical protein [Trifolium medium]
RRAPVPFRRRSSSFVFGSSLSGHLSAGGMRLFR